MANNCIVCEGDGFAGNMSDPCPACSAFAIGERVNVLRATRLPKVEEVVGQGTITRVTESQGTYLYWIDGFAVARTARELRHAA